MSILAGRSSKAIEELQVAGMGRPNPAETRTGDTAILNVVEAYCNSTRLKTLIRKTYMHMYVQCLCDYDFVHTCYITSHTAAWALQLFAVSTQISIL